MQTKIKLAAGQAVTISRNGSFLALLAASDGVLRVKALDAAGRELFDSDMFAGNSIDFGFVAAQLVLTSKSDGDAVIFWANSRLNNNAVSVKGSGAMRIRSYGVWGQQKLNSITAQNKKVLLKCAKGEVRLTSSPSLTLGSYKLAEGEKVELDTSADIYAFTKKAFLTPNIGAVRTVKSFAASNDTFVSRDGDGALIYFMRSGNGLKMADKDGNDLPVFLEGSNTNAVPWSSALLKTPDNRFFVGNAGGGTILVYELVGNVLKTMLSLSYPGASGAVKMALSLDGETMLLMETANNRLHSIDLPSRSIQRTEVLAQVPGLNQGCNFVPFEQGWLFFGTNGLAKIDRDLQVELLNGSYTGYGSVSISNGALVEHGYTKTDAKLSYDNGNSFITAPSFFSHKGLLAVGDAAAGVDGNRKVRIFTEFSGSFEVTTAVGEGDKVSFLGLWVDADKNVFMRWTHGYAEATSKILEVPLGQLSLPDEPAVIECVELY